MAKGLSITSLGNDEYRITWAQPVKFDLKILLLACLHQIKVLSQEESEDGVIGVEGERELLLGWLRSLGMIDEESMKTYEAAMAASFSSALEHQENKIAEDLRGTAQRRSGKHQRRHKS